MTNSIIKILFVSTTILLLAGCGAGKTGPAGKDGKDAVGPNAAGGIVSSTNCSGTIFGLSGQAAALNGIEVAYNVVVTTGGDVYATAHVADEYAQVSGTAFYSNEQNGAALGTVNIVADYHGTADAGSWDINLDRNTLETSVAYEDDSLNGGTPVVLNFQPSACVQNDF